VTHKFCTIAIVALVLFWPKASPAYDLARHVTEFRLQNGMRWLIVRRQQAPVFSGIVMVRAGGVDEREGKTGVAHMFEHMAFKGSGRIGTKDWARERGVLARIERLGSELTAVQRAKEPDAAKIAEVEKRMAAAKEEAARYQIKNEIWEILMRNGAKGINAYTSKDVTAYYASMPVSRLPLWAEVTAEMVFAPVFRDFYTERSVVAEERRTSIENSPGGALVERLLSASYEGGPYSWSTIGLEEDVLGLTIADAREFHRRNYVPSSMIGVIVGDVNVARTKVAVVRAFGRYPKRKRPPEPEAETAMVGGVKERFKFDAAPSVAIAYHKPTLPDPAEYTFDVILSLLCEGSSSRLKKRLVFDDRLAKDVYCSDGFPGSRLPNLFLIWVEPLKGRSVRKILKVVNEEIAKLRDAPVEESELARVRKMVTATIMFALDSNDKLAEELARFQTIFGDWRLLGDYPKMISRVTAGDVGRIANEYMTDSKRIVVERRRR